MHILTRPGRSSVEGGSSVINGVSTLSYSVEMDWVLLWLTAKILGHRTTTLRVTLAAIVGVLPTLWVLLRQNLYAVPWELGLVWPAVMLAVLLQGLPRRFWLKAFVLFFAMSFMAGGLLNAGLSWLKLYTSGFPALDWAFLAPAALIGLGLWMPKRRVRQMIGRESYGDISLELDGRTCRVPVLWDSGNELTAGRTHRPVVIVELNAVLDFIPSDLLPWIIRVQQEEAAAMPPERWRERASVVTFRTLAGSGLLPVVELDGAQGRYLDRWHAMVPVVLGFARQAMTPDHSYRALATPKSLLNNYPKERVGA